MFLGGVAGKQRGKGDNRYLWPEMLRVVHEIRPRWVLGENVAGIVRMELDNVLSDLEGEGYTCQAFVIPACAVNAPHKRERVWVLAYAGQHDRSDLEVAGDNGQASEDYKEGQERSLQFTRPSGCSGGDKDVADATREGLLEWSQSGFSRSIHATEHGGGQERGWWLAEPQLGRVAHGIPHRVDRLKCLGNAIVPQVAYEILKGIAKIERGVE
jgi:Site-specific DNA methylase